MLTKLFDSKRLKSEDQIGCLLQAEMQVIRQQEIGVGTYTIGGLKKRDPSNFESLDKHSPRTKLHKMYCANKVFTATDSFNVENATF